MKNTFKILVAAIAITISSVTYKVNAQTAFINLLLNSEMFFPGSFINGGEKNKDVPGTGNERALKDFQRTFGNVNNVTWLETKNGGYIAKFVNADVKTVVAYNPKGSWSYTINYYGEKKLPADIRKMVKSTYYDYSIFGIAEVHFDKETVYMLYIQDESHFKTIRVYNDEMQEVENYPK
jgi:hypothetical protein